MSKETYIMSLETIKNIVEQSIELFQAQGALGSWLLVYILACVIVAVLTYPRYHKRGFTIFIILLLVTVTLVYNNELYHGTSLIGIHTLRYTIYGIWYSIVFAFFYWIIIGILSLCKQDNKLNIGTRVCILLFSTIIICLTAKIWYDVLTTLIFITAALL